ncbi:hypothetical protein ACTD5D_32160 [Nocardia takedensis]|uniref:hypothetical protein n=1 Tax=Nocardia takedensis TaxID=259390 RepID=UPI003F7683CF
MADTLIARINAAGPPRADDHDRVVFGVRWTNDTGAVVVHQVHDAETARPLASALRALQARDHRTPDAHVVTRQMRGAAPVTEWVAAPGR